MGRIASSRAIEQLAEVAGWVQTGSHYAGEVGNGMKHAVHRVRAFEIVAPYTLCVRFEDATEQTINFEPILAGELYRPLRDLQLFNAVRIDSDAHTLVWPNGADFDPATLHDWPRYESNFRALARRWATVQA